MTCEEVLTPTGQPLAYAIIERQDDGSCVCHISAALADALARSSTKRVGVLECKQARALSKEREAAAFSRAVKDADCCVDCTVAIQDHYDRLVDVRADNEIA